MAISTPQQQAGVVNYYDAPEKGVGISPRLLLIGIAIFVIIIIIFDHAALFA